MSAERVMSYEIGPQICAALGLNADKARKIVITLEVDKPVVIEITRSSTAKEMGDVAEVFEGRYTLRKQEP